MVVNFRGKDLNAAGVRVSGTKITATPDELNQALDGISADVTAANLSELTGGAETDLHSHGSGPSIAFSGIAVEASTSADTTAALTVDDPTQQYKVGEWANSVAGDLVLPQSGWYEVVLTATIAASGDGGNLLELLLNSDDSDLLCDFKEGGAVGAKLPVHPGTSVQHYGVLIGLFEATAGQTIGGVYLYQVASGGSLSTISALHVGVRISLVAAA